MSAERDDVLRQGAAMERVMALADAYGFDVDADAQQAVYEALLAYAAEERDALIAALVAEYAAILRQEGPWEERGSALSWAPLRLGGCEALRRVADRLGVVDLHAQAADMVAREETGEERDDGR